MRAFVKSTRSANRNNSINTSIEKDRFDLPNLSISQIEEIENQERHYLYYKTVKKMSLAEFTLWMENYCNFEHSSTSEYFRNHYDWSDRDWNYAVMTDVYQEHDTPSSVIDFRFYIGDLYLQGKISLSSAHRILDNSEPKIWNFELWNQWFPKYAHTLKSNFVTPQRTAFLNEIQSNGKTRRENRRNDGNTTGYHWGYKYTHFYYRED